jgi:hypothetical protein
MTADMPTASRSPVFPLAAIAAALATCVTCVFILARGW